MKTCFLLLTFLIFTNVLVFGQGPTLTADNTAPQPGDIFSSHFADTTGIQTGSAGANQTWDYSNLNIDTLQYIQTYVLPSSTPYGASFPDATVCFSHPPTYSYLKVTSSDYSIIGLGFPLAIEIYSDPQKTFSYPFAYPDSFTDQQVSSYSTSAVSFYRMGTTSTTADGWGTLKLSTGNYSNMVRIKFKEDLRDSTVTKATGQSPETYSVTLVHNVSYYWFDGINKNPALTILKASNTVNGNTYYGTYVIVSSAVSAIPSNLSGRSALVLFPEPAHSKVTLSVTLIHPSNVTLVLINSSGLTIRDFGNFSLHAGENRKDFDLEGISKGLYFIRMTSDQESDTQKLLVE